ncbi:MAG: hypothetical protein ABI693_06930 [Bryobacteraceae bacterium]
MFKTRSMLAALDSGEECESLRAIVSAAGWAFHVAPAFPYGDSISSLASCGVVVCGARFNNGRCWKDVLRETRRLTTPPNVIVADRLADEALWAEVLNLGCYDLLMTPFVAEEVLRLAEMAWDSWEREMVRAAAA